MKNPIDFGGLRGKGPDCPSDLVLEQFQMGECSPGEAKQVHAHVVGCAGCRKRLEHIQVSTQDLPFDSKAATDRLVESLAGAEVPAEVQKAVRESIGRNAARSGRTAESRPRAPSRLAMGLGFALAAAASAVLLVVVLQSGTSKEGGQQGDLRDVVRIKGGFSLSVYLSRAGRVEEISTGAALRPGDKLRFRVDIPAGGNIMVVGVDATGSRYPCYPAGGKASRTVAAGKGQELSGAVMVDEAPGDEWLHLVLCPGEFSLPQVRPTDRPGGLQIPEGCVSTPFQVTKEP